MSDKKIKALLEAAKTLIKADFHEQAIPYLQKLIEIDPENAVAHYNIGYLYIKLCQYENAIKSLEKSIEIDPEHASAYRDLSDAYWQSGEYNLAEEYLRVAEKLDQEHVVNDIINRTLEID